MLGEDRRHPLAILQALTRYRYQKLQGHVRQNQDAEGNLRLVRPLVEDLGRKWRRPELPRSVPENALASARSSIADPMDRVASTPTLAQVRYASISAAILSGVRRVGSGERGVFIHAFCRRPTLAESAQAAGLVYCRQVYIA